jgi:proteic killer suppression protein
MHMGVIVSFLHKGLEIFYLTGSTCGISASHSGKRARLLLALDAAVSPQELNLPSFKLHPLKGNLKDHWSIWINGNWRVTFRFSGTDVELVDYLDYH